MTDWHATLSQIQSDFPGLEIAPPAPPDAVELAASQVGELPADLRELYRAANGLTFVWFRLHPVFDESRVKTTWDSIQRVNDPATAPDSARGWPELAQRFLIFASLGGPGFAAFERSQGTIWYFEDGELHETDLDLAGFIRTVAREVQELP